MQGAANSTLLSFAGTLPSNFKRTIAVQFPPGQNRWFNVRDTIETVLDEIDR